MKVEILKVEDGIIEPLGMPACMTGCSGGGGSYLIGTPCANASFLAGQYCG